jgi:2-methylcitrate synthase
MSDRPSVAFAWPVTASVGPGLEGAVAATTRVSSVGERGTLEIRGVPVEVLAGRASFEEVACLLIHGVRPTEEMRDELRAGRHLPEGVAAMVCSLPRDTHPTRMLRAAVSALGCFEPPGEDHGPRIVGQVAALAGVVARHRRDLSPLRVEPGASIAERLTAAIADGPADRVLVEALDLCLVLYADNGMDAPTFCSMVVGSARADPYYNVVAGLSALRGPRVGGASELILRALLPIADATAARTWVRNRLDAGQRIPGFGHRVFRAPDPRVAILRERAEALAVRRGDRRLLDIARAVEEEAGARLETRGIHPNVNLYAAVIFHLCGADPEMLPCLIAVGRMAGLVARVGEYLAHNRLIRPLCRYVGPAERRFVPLEER